LINSIAAPSAGVVLTLAYANCEPVPSAGIIAGAIVKSAPFTEITLKVFN